ncbi:MAG: transcriptional regulator [Rhizobiales bacterium 24-66-13]|uniref:cyclic nucleotide-binding domain-containing protein n=1 Tax=Roseixanthobacter finlandensis TaxID=3119922 RepID=UPI000BCB6436|nr:MAG: transcriptional regulator [Rhizobiales bacterium 35-66-30]OYZ71810.1 MAG: transcriptional regulator [Rhizobiales bacterium 24-66-13]OZB03289.1 MAG: transcriptional regulator [Rhizobiales bacterium 39-66-18]HQS49533.1 cyclic nucleotide-binding domain-containing protein [Xanthobacteraceae bacterium]
MRIEDAAVIRELPLFRNVEHGAFARLIDAGFLQRFPPGVVLIQESDRADFLHVVVEGTAELFAGTGGRETTIELVRPVGLFILAAVLRDQVYLQSARTLERSLILMLPAESVRATLEADPAFMRAVVMELAGDYRRTIRDLKNLKLRNGAERLANWLIRAELEQGATGAVEIPVEKRTVAARLGMTPENLSRAFATLAEYGVRTKGARVEFTDRSALVAYAKPDPLVDLPD